MSDEGPAAGEPIRRGAFDSELSIQAASATTWHLTVALIWTGTHGDTFIVPAGFVTDFATVPRFLHWKISPYGAYTRAAVLHDWLLVQLATWERSHRSLTDVEGRTIDGGPPADSRDCDGIFRRVMQDLGVSWWTRWTMWSAVRWAALFNPNRAYGRRFAADLPRVLGMTLLAVPSTVPGAVGVLISLAIDRMITGFVKIVRRK